MAVTNYTWDPDFDHIMKENVSGVATAEYNCEPVRNGRLLSQRRNNQASYYHYDGQGSTIALTDNSGNVTDTYAYDAWGNGVSSTGTTENSLRFVGLQQYYFDPETCDYYVRARHYRSVIARWTSRDPLDAPNTDEPYAYVLNDPVNRIDPSGLQWNDQDTLEGCAAGAMSTFIGGPIASACVAPFILSLWRTAESGTMMNGHIARLPARGQDCVAWAQVC